MSQKHRAEILKEISALKGKIAAAEYQNKNVDELLGDLVLLRSDLLILATRYNPPWINRLNVIGGSQ